MLTRALREPLLHFLLLGGLLFVGFRLLNTEPPPAPDTIIVTARDLAGLEQSFEAAWRRPPTEPERAALIDSHIRQEVLVREAQALGLHRDDAVIRQRLQQKMEFLLASSANALQPSDADLQAYLQDHADRYQQAGQVAFDQVFLGQTATLEAVDAARAALDAGADPLTLGPQSLLPSAMALTPAQAIDSTFGTGFAAILADIPAGDWAGPVLSGYGVHVVRVTRRTPPTLPDLAQIRDRVEAAWRKDKAQELAEALYQELRTGFMIEIEVDPGADGATGETEDGT